MKHKMTASSGKVRKASDKGLYFKRCGLLWSQYMDMLPVLERIRGLKEEAGRSGITITPELKRGVDDACKSMGRTMAIIDRFADEYESSIGKGGAR